MIKRMRQVKMAVVGMLWVGLLLMGVLGACRGSGGQPAEPAVATQDAAGAVPTATEEEPEPQSTAGVDLQLTPTAEDAAPETHTEHEAGTAPIAEESGDAGPRFAYRINPEKSEARFRIQELLFGDPKTVVGRTNRIEGEIQIDLSNPHSVVVSPIRIDALGLRTDDSFRNRSLRRFILESSKEEYRYIVFDPMSIEGLPDKITFGEAVSLQMTGHLTVRDITKPVTFDMVVVPESETRLSGSGSTTILRSDFNLKIPRVPGVASVSEEVVLEFDFVAERVLEGG